MAFMRTFEKILWKIEWLRYELDKIFNTTTKKREK